MAEWLDNSAIVQRTRNRILGHVNDVPGGYGRKGTINANQMAAISALEPEIVKQMREILVAAKERAERATGLVSRKEQEAVCCANALFRTLARSHQMTLARFETQSHGTYRSLRPLPYLSLIRKGLPCRHAFRSLRWCS